ncbi:glycosyl transferase [Modestobacter sp. I12A-02628]|uniref:Glycosyltransferase family 39 protein n=1 Tax=Goekera deserti TaxID=2497753 RepID=A0A7K3WC56_9ACTN|nr:glycosyltransferase family 39 protein [Goekera deserti]MPQ98477.1 glycosyl transferase [Goekera deserti]NDI48306.1 glycosyl transferase [Goekera deserti]NEL54055.1 glycosyltransferase family 39 protein [Goekera deserti]
MSTVTTAPPGPAGPASPGLPAAPPAAPRSRLQRLLRGRVDDPAWVRPSLAGLLAGTGLLYLWDLSVNGYANSFYAAAVQAGTQSWEAFFYGSSDAANSITVDKPPGSLWIMELSGRVFGFSSWSMLAPQALMGVATVGLVYLAVRRVSGPALGLLAGLVMALTPVAVLMFRFNNPDAQLVLLMTAAAYATVRAVERASLRWLVGVGVLLGLAFLTKTLQAVLVLPGFALAYLVAAPTVLWARVRHLLVAGAAFCVSCGWWIAVVELVPADSRPYIGGSEGNSTWELIWGYNGLGRIFGEGSAAGGGGAGGFNSDTGLTRMFDSSVGGQIAWLLPAALVLLVGGLVAVGRAPRTDLRRASLLLWGSWLLVTAAVFSFMQGTFHQYYTVALAPAIAALVGIGGRLLWQRRAQAWPRLVLAGTVLGTAVWSAVLLSRTPDHLPWLRWVVVVAGVLAAVALTVGHLPVLGRRGVLTGLVAALLVVGLGGPAAYAASTVSTPLTGSVVTAGPAGASTGGGFGGGPGRAGGGPPAGMQPPPGVDAPSGAGTGDGAGAAGRPGGGAGPGGEGQVSDQVTTLVAEDADSYTWAAATTGSTSAAGYQLATGDPVMAIGGFSGSDPSPTLAQFQQYVADGEVHWYVSGSGAGGRGGGGTAGEISTWVAATFTATTVDGVTLYDLTQPAG